MLLGNRLLLVTFAAGTLAAGLAGQASAATLKVCPSGCAYSDVQTAVDAAQNSDRIKIAAGTYNPVNTDDKSIRLQGAGAADTTINGAGFDETAIYIGSGTVKIRGLTITDALIDQPPAGGIYNGGTLTLTDSTVSDNFAFYAAGIYNSGTMTLKDSTVADNTSNRIGGGIFNSGTMTLEDSTVTNNNAPDSGGGIANDGTMTLKNSMVTNNNSTVGGGIENDATMTLKDSTITNNTGGGILTFDGTTTTLLNTTVNCNVPTDITGPYTQKHSTIGGCT
jgi:hypothetical protein